MAFPSAAPAVLIASVLLLVPLSGCIWGSDTTPVESSRIGLDIPDVGDALRHLQGLLADPIVLDADKTINVVFVGIDEGRLDLDEIEAALPKDYSPDIKFSIPRDDDNLRSGLIHQIGYDFHFAPEEFASRLFDQYEDFSREVDAPAFLARYDDMYELGRADDPIRLVDAEKVEDWIEEQRDAYDLRFEKPSYTLFFLDSWTHHELWTDSYYYYEFANDTRGGGDVRNMRAWGGTYDFMFMDYSAAPNDSGNDNTGVTKVDVCCGVSQPVPAPEGTAWNDPPAWHYAGGSEATIGLGDVKTVTLSERVTHAVDVAVNVRLLGDYAFKPVYKENYHINVHLWHDGRSMIPSDDLDAYLDEERLFSGLAAQIPWADVSGTIDTYVAPQDDPGMADALDRAKAEAVGTSIPIQPIWQYVDANKEQYRQNDPDVFDVMALLFILEGHYAFFLPLIVGGVAFSGPDGTAWGTISSVNDYRYIQNGESDEYVSNALTTINAHELGHFFGLTHAHDGSRRTADGYDTDFLDHTWSSTNTVMSYRTRPETTDLFHRDILARAHTLENQELTLRNTNSAYRALASSGVSQTPAEILSLLEEASKGYDQAEALYLGGEYQEAVVHAIEARRATELAMQAAGVTKRDVVVESWSQEGVNNIGYKHSAAFFRPSVDPTGILFDYRAIEITDDVERVKVEIQWENNPTSWGDFFIGWSRDPIPVQNVTVDSDNDVVVSIPNINFGPVQHGAPVGLGGGVHDYADEGPSDGEVSHWFILDMDQFQAFRGEALYFGAGTQGMAVNGAYDVQVTLTYRDHGDLDPEVPDGAESSMGGNDSYGERIIDNLVDGVQGVLRVD